MQIRDALRWSLLAAAVFAAGSLIALLAERAYGDEPRPWVAEENTLAATWCASVHHPSHAADYLAWHKATYPALWAGDSLPPQPPPGALVLEVLGDGWAAVGLPVEAEGVWRATGPGGSVVAHVGPLADGWSGFLFDPPAPGTYHLAPDTTGAEWEWPDTSAPPFSCSLNGESATWVLMDERWAGGAAEAHYQHTGDAGQVLHAWTWTFPGGTVWTFLAARNTTPMATKPDNAGQPDPSYGAPSTRPFVLEVSGTTCLWSEEITGQPAGADPLTLASYQLRGGEQWGWWLWNGQPPAWALAPGGVYMDALGPVGLYPQAADGTYDLILEAAVRGLAERQYPGVWDDAQNVRGRDFGDWNRDFEGPSESTTKTHNAEYDAPLGLLLAVARYRTATDGRSDLDEIAWEAAVRAGWHFANVDLHHVESGPLEWLWGAPWQHPRHGGAGGMPHRSTYSPDPGHFMGHHVRVIGLLLADNPLLRDASDLLERRTVWKVENGPGMPGLSNSTGEMRAPAYLLQILLDAWEYGGDEAARDAASRVMREASGAKPWLAGRQEGRYKPPFLALFTAAVERAAAAVVAPGDSLLPICRDVLAGSVAYRGGLPHLFYEVSYVDGRPSSDNDMPGAFWNALAADLLVESHPDLADGLYRGWIDGAGQYPGADPTKYARVLASFGNLMYGARYTAVRGAALPPTTPPAE